MSIESPPTPGAAGVRAAMADLPGYCRLLVVGVAVNRLASFVEIFLVLYLVHQGRPAAAAGLALTVFGAGAVLGVLGGGLLVERIGARRTIVASMACAGGSTALLPLVQDLGALVLLSGVIGVATQLFRPAAVSLLAAASTPGDLVLVMAGYRFGLNLGAVITPLLGAALAVWSWHAVFAVDAVSSLVFAGVAWRHLPSDRPAARAPGRLAGGWPVLDRGFLLVASGFFLIAAVEVQYIVTLPLEVHRRGLPTEVFSGLVALNGFLVIALEPRITTRVRHWPVPRLLWSGVGLIGLGIAGYGLPGGAVALALATVVWTVGEMLGAPAAGAYPALAAPPHAVPRYLAVAGAAQGVGYAVGPVLGVALYTGSPALCWLVCACLGLVAAGLVGVGARLPMPGTPTSAPGAPG